MQRCGAIKINPKISVAYMLIFATPNLVYFTLSVQGIDLNVSKMCRNVQFSFFDKVSPIW